MLLKMILMVLCGFVIAAPGEREPPVKYVNTTGMAETEYWELIENRKGTLLITAEPYIAVSETEGKNQYGDYIRPHIDVEPGEGVLSFYVWNPGNNAWDDAIARFDF